MTLLCRMKTKQMTFADDKTDDYGFALQQSNQALSSEVGRAYCKHVIKLNEKILIK